MPRGPDNDQSRSTEERPQPAVPSTSTRIVPPVPRKGMERAQWWLDLYDAIADDADHQRAVLLSYDLGDPDHAAKWFEDYRTRLHELADHAIDRREWAP